MVGVTKKTLGRRKIEMKKIEKKGSLAVTFTKRRSGLFNKASELSLVCGAQIAIVVQSPAGKIYSFGEDALIQRFLMGEAPPPPDHRQIMAQRQYEEAVRRLEMEKRKVFRWNEPYEGLELDQLEDYLEGLESLADEARKRAEEKETEELLKLHTDDYDFDFGSVNDQHYFTASSSSAPTSNSYDDGLSILDFCGAAPDCALLAAPDCALLA